MSNAQGFWNRTKECSKSLVCTSDDHHCVFALGLWIPLAAHVRLAVGLGGASRSSKRKSPTFPRSLTLLGGYQTLTPPCPRSNLVSQGIPFARRRLALTPNTPLPWLQSLRHGRRVSTFLAPARWTTWGDLILAGHKPHRTA